MRFRLIWLAAMIVLLGAGLFGHAGCDCGGDDDDSSGDGGGGSGVGAEDCQAACDAVFQCGGSLWYQDVAECNDLCGEWLTTGIDCANCFIGCWTVDSGCVDAGLCMADCALGACADWLAEIE